MKQVQIAKRNGIVLYRESIAKNLTINDVLPNKFSNMWGDRLTIGAYRCCWIIDNGEQIIAQISNGEMISVNNKGWTIHV